MIDRERLVEIGEQEMGKGGLFVYDSEAMAETARSLLSADMPYGMTTRYAAKANGHPDVISLFDETGLHFDASSAGEAEYLVKQGVAGEKISLSSQILDDEDQLHYLLGEGVKPVATTLRHIGMLARTGLDTFAARINPDKGSGHSNRTNVGGPASSFGIWHEQLDEVQEEAARHDVVIDRIHTHIGSGVDPDVWRDTIQASLDVVERFPDVETLDIGGGYKVGRMPDEASTDMQEVLQTFGEELEEFSERTGREIHLEIEPGTLLVANAGILLGRVKEMVSTSQYDFLRINFGMNANPRPSLYGSQHPLEVLKDSDEEKEYVVVGPCCESGDILTPMPRDPEGIKPRKLKVPKIGDIIAMGGVGAYCASMAMKDYNSAPRFTEVMV